MPNDNEKEIVEASVCFLVRGDDVLLARKTRHIGRGLWNGYGGGLDEGEDEIISLVREVREECSIEVDRDSLEKVALVHCHNTKSDGRKFTLKLHVYFAHAWEGEPQESEEMTSPTWFPRNALPLHEMMGSDLDWIPHIMEGKKLIAHSYLGPFQKEKLQETEIEFVTVL